MVLRKVFENNDFTVERGDYNVTHVIMKNNLPEAGYVDTSSYFEEFMSAISHASSGSFEIKIEDVSYPLVGIYESYVASHSSYGFAFKGVTGSGNGNAYIDTEAHFVCSFIPNADPVTP